MPFFLAPKRRILNVTAARRAFLKILKIPAVNILALFFMSGGRGAWKQSDERAILIVPPHSRQHNSSPSQSIARNKPRRRLERGKKKTDTRVERVDDEIIAQSGIRMHGVT